MEPSSIGKAMENIAISEEDRIKAKKQKDWIVSESDVRLFLALKQAKHGARISAREFAHWKSEMKTYPAVVISRVQ